MNILGGRYPFPQTQKIEIKILCDVFEKIRVRKKNLSKGPQKPLSTFLILPRVVCDAFENLD